MKSSSSSLLIPRVWPRGGLGLFGWVRLCMMRAAWQALLRAPLKLGVIVSAWGGLLVGGFLLAHQGLAFIYETAGLGPFLLDRLWYLFMFLVAIMLMVSQVATAYSTMIRSDESAFWMSLPLSARWVLRAKWVESSCYSAWAVVLLILPLGLAYLTVIHQPLWILGWILAILLPLVGIVTALSTIILLVWLRWVRIPLLARRELIPLGLVAVGLALFWLFGALEPERQRDVWFLALQELLPRMRVATSMWVPSSWMARALGACVNQRWVEASLFGALLWTTCLMSARLLEHVAACLLVPVLRRQADRGECAGCAPGTMTSLRIRWWMRRAFLACVVKDVLLLLRDPTQWIQGLVFFGLLGTYFANLHRMAGTSVAPSWRIGVSSLNLACTLLVLGALAVRFLFPQMSLEGRRLWLVHVAPGGLRSLLYAKLVFYGALAIVLVEGLLALSAMRLQLPGVMVWWLAGVGVLASLSLVGLALGLGALLIDPSVSDPARMVSSSSGALALLLMLVYIGGVAWSLTLAWTAHANHHPQGFLLATLALIAASGVLGYLPLKQGIRALERLEF